MTPMLGIEDIDRLAALARIEIPEAEKETLRKEVDSILAYVADIQKASGTVPPHEDHAVRNVLRNDDAPHLRGEHTADLLSEAPRTQDGYIKVKKIL